MLGYPPTPPPPPPRGARQLTARPADPQSLGQPTAYSPQNCRTPLGVTHWLAVAPVPPPPQGRPYKRGGFQGGGGVLCCTGGL